MIGLKTGSKKWLSSENWIFQVLGAIIKNIRLLLVLLLMLLFSLFAVNSDNTSQKESQLSIVATTGNDSLKVMSIRTIIQKNDSITTITVCPQKLQIETQDNNLTWIIVKHPIFQITFLFFFVWLAISVCQTLTDINVLLKKEIRITICQFSILLSLGFGVLGILLILDIKDNPRYAAVLGIAGALLTWIFQDTVKGVAAFVHLRYYHLLNIDDWIKIPKYEVDGMVTRVTLTTVTLYNWDTTTSSIPISVLHSDHFINLQNMMEGKTYGRRMFMKFIFDTNWICKMSVKDITKLKSNKEVLRFLPENEIAENETNAYLFRIYLYHWLMRNPHVSQQPRLIVTWLEQVEYGMPLQVYAFITDSSLQGFEWQQSLIVEHIMMSLEWFGLRLYQSPSAYDVSNSNIHLTDKPATYRREGEV